MTVPPIVTVTNAGGPATLHSFDSPSEDKTAALYSPDDKASSLPHLSPRSVVSDLPGTPSYTAAEEAAVRLKLDMLLMPLLFFGFYVFSLDRGNIANALSNGFMHDVGIQQDQFNTGQALLNVGIILLEVPSTYVLLWIGPNLWLSLQVFAFGFVSIFQLYQKGVGAYYATRLLLGLTEAGYIPGALYIISSFYRQNELGKRNAFFFLAAGIGSATSGLWAYAIFPLGVSRPQMKGWQWMWLIEGLMTVFVAMVFILLLPASPHDPRSVARISIFSSRERDVLVGRVVAEEAAKKEADRRLNLKEILKTLGNWRIWPHMLIAIAGIALRAVLMLYAPALIQSFRFDTLTANALSSVGGWVSVIMTAVFGILTDKTNLRGPMCITTLALFLVFWIAFQQKSLVDDRWLKFGLIVMVQGFTWAFHPINATWLAVNVRTPQHRAVALAMFVMAANAGAAIGTQLLRQDDAPLYTKGFKGAIGMAAIALGAALAQSVQYTWTNKRLDRRVANQGGEYGGAAGVAGWRYTP